MGKYRSVYKSLEENKLLEADKVKLTKELFLSFANELKEMVEDLSLENFNVEYKVYDGLDGQIEMLYKGKVILTYYSKYDNHRVLVIFGKYNERLHSEMYSIEQFNKYIKNDEIVGFNVEKVTKQHFESIYEKVNTH